MADHAFPFEVEAIEPYETNAARTTACVHDERAAFALRRIRKVGTALCVALALIAFDVSAQSARERRARQAAERQAVEQRAEQSAETSEPDARRERRSGRRNADEPTVAVPEAAAAALERALAAMRAENWIEAELELENLTLEYPTYPGPYVNLALVHRKAGRRDEARAALDRALALDPAHPVANTELGILLREDGKFAEAEQAYRRALDADADYALAHYNFGVLLDIYLGRPAEALERYERYQSLLAQPDETVARWIIDLRRRVDSAGAARATQ